DTNDRGTARAIAPWRIDSGGFAGAFSDGWGGRWCGDDHLRRCAERVFVKCNDGGSPGKCKREQCQCDWTAMQRKTRLTSRPPFPVEAKRFVDFLLRRGILHLPEPPEACRACARRAKEVNAPAGWRERNSLAIQRCL